MAAVCHVTNMTRHHGNIKRECYKITVALKKTITKHGFICDSDLKSCRASASRETQLPIGFLFFSFYRFQSGTFISFLFLKLVKNLTQLHFYFLYFFLFHASYYDTAALLFSLFLNFLLFYVYSLYFRYYLLVQ